MISRVQDVTVDRSNQDADGQKRHQWEVPAIGDRWRQYVAPYSWAFRSQIRFARNHLRRSWAKFWRQVKWMI